MLLAGRGAGHGRRRSVWSGCWCAPTRRAGRAPRFWWRWPVAWRLAVASRGVGAGAAPSPMVPMRLFRDRVVRRQQCGHVPGERRSISVPSAPTAANRGCLARGCDPAIWGPRSPYGNSRHAGSPAASASARLSVLGLRLQAAGLALLGMIARPDGGRADAAADDRRCAGCACGPDRAEGRLGVVARRISARRPAPSACCASLAAPSASHRAWRCSGGSATAPRRRPSATQPAPGVAASAAGRRAAARASPSTAGAQRQLGCRTTPEEARRARRHRRHRQRRVRATAPRTAAQPASLLRPHDRLGHRWRRCGSGSAAEGRSRRCRAPAGSTTRRAAFRIAHNTAQDFYAAALAGGPAVQRGRRDDGGP